MKMFHLIVIIISDLLTMATLCFHGPHAVMSERSFRAVVLMLLLRLWIGVRPEPPTDEERNSEVAA